MLDSAGRQEGGVAEVVSHHDRGVERREVKCRDRKVVVTETDVAWSNWGSRGVTV